MIKYFLKTRLLPALITSVPLWLLVDLITDGYFPPISKVMFYISLLLLFSQFIRIVSIMVAEIVLGTNVTRNAVGKLRQWGKRLVAQMKNALHAKVLGQFVVRVFSKGPKKRPRRGRRMLLHLLLKERGDLPDSPELSRLALKYIVARAVIGGCVSACVKLLVLLLYEIAYDKHLLVWKYVVLFVVYGVPFLFSKRILKRYGFRYARKFWELYVKGDPDKSSTSKRGESSDVN